MSAVASESPRALLMVHTNSWFTEMHRLATFFKETGRYEPVVQFAYSYPTIEKDKASLRAENIEYGGPEPAMLSWALERVLSVLDRASRHRLLSFARNIVIPAIGSVKNLGLCLAEIRHYRRVVQDQRAVLVVMAGDLVGYNTPEIVKSAHDNGVPCVIVPSTMSDGTEQAEAYFFDDNFSLSRPFNRLVAWFWPKWKRQHKGKWLLRLPGEQIIARELLDISPPLPWVSSSSRADRVAVESLAMWDYYRRAGIDAEKLRYAGTLANDAMAGVTLRRDELRSQLRRNLGLDPGRGLVLTALPPDFLYMRGGRPDCEFQDYRSLIDYWIRTLHELRSFNIVVSVHPSVDIADFKFLETERVRVASQRMVELVPLCDVFVASVSSTIRWAIACSKPVVNYDVYQYHYDDFTAVRGVVFVDRKEAYRDVLMRIDTDPAFLQRLRDEVGLEASRWGRLDGGEGARLLALFEDERARYRPRGSRESLASNAVE